MFWQIKLEICLRKNIKKLEDFKTKDLSDLFFKFHLESNQFQTLDQNVKKNSLDTSLPSNYLGC